MHWYLLTKMIAVSKHYQQILGSRGYMALVSGGSRPGVWGGSQIGGRRKCLHLFKHQSLSAKIVGCHTKVVKFCRPKSGYCCWSNYAIFQGIGTVWMSFISLIQKRFETDPKQWASFFTSYTDLLYLQMYLKSLEACCTQAFATVLAIPSKISEEQCVKRIPDLVISRTVLLRLGSNNSCPTIGPWASETGGREGLCPSWILKLLARKGCFFNFEG